MLVNNLKLTSDYPNDKINWMHQSGPYNVGPPSIVYTISTGTTYKMLPILYFSTTADFTDSIPEGADLYDNAGNFLYSFASYIQGDQIGIVAFRGSSVSPFNFYVRGIGYASSEYTGPTPNILSSNENKFLISTDNNMPKLTLNNTITVNDGAIGQVAYSISDNPSLFVWYEFLTDNPGVIYPLSPFDYGDSILGGQIHTRIENGFIRFVNNTNAGNIKFYYRAYEDG